MVQRRAARWVTGRYHDTSGISDMLRGIDWRSLEQRRADSRLTILYKIRNHLAAIKDKDIKIKIKKPYFNVAYNVTDNISSRAILRHNNIFNRYLPALLYLPSTTPFMRASARELLVPFFTPLVWCSRGIRTHDLPLRKRKLYQLSY